MNTLFVMLAVTIASNGDVKNYEPITPQLYSTQALCKADQQNQLAAHPKFAKGYAIICGRVERDSDY